MNRQQFKRIARDGFKLSEADCPDSRLDELYDDALKNIAERERKAPMQWAIAMAGIDQVRSENQQFSAQY